MTADPNEQHVLDVGQIPGWTRTSYQYAAIFALEAESDSLAPVCRFCGLPTAGINSHFFSEIPSDCAIVIDRWPESWELETRDAFKAMPLQPDGFCPLDLQLFVRMYYNKSDVNHRYTTSETQIAAMKSQGWIEEGPVWCTDLIFDR